PSQCDPILDDDRSDSEEKEVAMLVDKAVVDAKDYPSHRKIPSKQGTKYQQKPPPNS
ncbi:hypothetical protein AVEN_21422-1, partial [Araneus ventricosus]